MVTTSADVSDLRRCVRFAKDQFPEAPVYALGFSMGANSLVKMLGEASSDSFRRVERLRFCFFQAGREVAEPLIHGAMCVSNPFDYVKLSHT
jgi:predicted alpha/beta-fold hydrolase